MGRGSEKQSILPIRPWRASSVPGSRASPQSLACSWEGMRSSKLQMLEAHTGCTCKMGVLAAPGLRFRRGEIVGCLRILQGLVQNENASPLFRDHRDFQGSHVRARDSAFLSMGPCGSATLENLAAKRFCKL